MTGMSEILSPPYLWQDIHCRPILLLHSSACGSDTQNRAPHNITEAGRATSAQVLYQGQPFSDIRIDRSEGCDDADRSMTDAEEGDAEPVH